MTKKWLFQTPSPPRIPIFQTRRISKAPQKERERGYPQALITLTLSELHFENRKTTLQQKSPRGKTVLPFVTQYQPSVPSLATDREPTSSQTDLQRTSNCMVQTRKVSEGYTPESQTLRLKGYKHLPGYRLPRQTVNKLVYCVTKFPLFLSLTVHYFYIKLSSFTQDLSARIVLRGCYRLISYICLFHQISQKTDVG